MKVVVTGSNSGFGRAIVEAFAAAGFEVIATVRRPAAAGGLTAEASGDRGPVSVVQLDVADAQSRHDAVKAIESEHGPVDVLVNNAGILRVGAIEDTPQGVLDEMYATNCFGPLDLARRFLPGMRSQGRGRIVNVTAIGAVLCTPFLGAYCATKHALDSASASLDLEVRSFGVRVASVLPGAFRTAITRNMPETSGAPASDYTELVESFKEGLITRIESGPADLSPVSGAVMAAATEPRPRARYLVGGPPHLGPIVDAMERAHEEEARRLGLDFVVESAASE